MLACALQDGPCGLELGPPAAALHAFVCREGIAGKLQGSKGCARGQRYEKLA